MDFTQLRSFNKVFPLYVEKYELFGVDENSSITEKINSMVQALNRFGRLSNDVVKDWNKVMEWAMGEGLDASVDKKVEELISNGRFDALLQPMFDEINVRVDSVETQLAQIATLVPLPNGTDDTTSIQNVINSLTNGATLIFPSGTYNYSTLTFNKNDIKVVSQGKVTLKCLTVTSSAISISGNNVTFEGISFDFNNKASVGLDIQASSKNITINKCEVKNAFNNSKDEVTALIKFQGNTSDITIRDCIIDTANNNSIGTSAPGVSRGIWMFVYNGQTCTQNVLISNCKINNITPRQDGDGIQLSGILNNTDKNNITIEKCLFTNCSKRAIKVMASGVVVQNNTISNTWTGTQADWSDGMHSAIAIYSSNVNVINNRIYGNSFQQVFDLSPDTSYWMKNINILDNYISVAEGSGTVLPYQGIIQVATNVDGLTITNNTIKKGTHGIFFRGIATNVFINRNNINISLKGVFLDVTAVAGLTTSMNYFVIGENIINSSGSYGIHITTGGDNISVIGNNITSSLEGIASDVSTILKTGNLGKLSSGVYLNWGTTLPTASVFMWRQVFTKYNSGADDTVHICIRLANNTYAWKQITLT